MWIVVPTACIYLLGSELIHDGPVRTVKPLNIYILGEDEEVRPVDNAVFLDLSLITLSANVTLPIYSTGERGRIG